MLIRWAKAHHAVPLLDDAHHLSGCKLDIAQRLALVSRPSGHRREPGKPHPDQPAPDPATARSRHRNLKSDAAYDATAVFLWLLILAAMGAGAWQLAAILGGMKFLGRGSMAELALTVAIVALCAVVIYTRKEVPGTFLPFFYRYDRLYKNGLIDGHEWKQHRFDFISAPQTHKIA